jgi:uncharacterized protein
MLQPFPTPANQNRAVTGHLAENIMHFGRVLRAAGIPVGPGLVMDALDAAMAGPLRKREDFYWTLHAVFVKRREHRELFDQAFHVFWKKPKMLQQLMQLMYTQIARKPHENRKQAGFRRLAEAMFDKHEVQSKAEPKKDALDIDATFTASADEVLRAKDFEQMSVTEQTEAMKALQRLKLNRIQIKTRRFRGNHAGHRIDMRRTMRTTIRAGGGIVQLARKQQTLREPPLVILCDISGSCSNYSRMFLHFLHTLINDRDRVHVFLFGTRLTNITRELARKDIDEAMSKVSVAVKDWSGGTRIGTALHEFNFKWGRRVLTQGAHVLLMTDGLDREDVAALATEMKRLRLSAKRIVWLNPLLRFEGFEARANGIRAIMPFVDEFRPVHSLNSLEDLASTLASPRSNAHDPKRWLSVRS